jgi:hypothetical protein
MCEKWVELSTESGERLRCRLADTFWARFRGLIGSDPPPPGEGLLIRPCNSIHMFFMKFHIDAVFLDRDYNVVRLVRDLAPGRIVNTVQKAWQVLEVAAGCLPASVQTGSCLMPDERDSH